MRWPAVVTAAISLGLVAFLAGCASHPSGHSHRHGGGYYQNDGPPDDEDIDVSKIPDAVPDDEPLSKFGNPSSYTALGKTYYVLQSSAGFTQTGRASWYGRQFHGERTSSGEPYNMFAMTAAHKRLPIPSWVRVTNLENGRQCVVKINDRGPFHDGRIIDLSYVAARRLGIVGNGSAPVRIATVTPASGHYSSASAPDLPQAPLRSAINPAEDSSDSNATATSQSSRSYAAPARPPAPNIATSGLYLQAGAFGSRANAQTLGRRLAAAGFGDVRILNPDAHMNLFRVWLGPYASENARENVRQQLAYHGFSAREPEPQS